MLTRNFITAGHAIFTVESKTGQWYTYRVTHSEGSEQFPPAWFVSVLTGPENTSDYTYLGMLDAETGAVKLTRKSRYSEDALPVKVVRWALGVLWRNEGLPEGYKVHHCGRCGRCGRALTVPSSVESGFGPECVKLV